MSLRNLHLLKKKRARNPLVSDSLNYGLNKQFSIMRFGSPEKKITLPTGVI